MIKVILWTLFVGTIGNGITLNNHDIDIGSILAISIMGGAILHRLDKLESKKHHKKSDTEE
ncbi:hypothetical protein [Clostridiisalibacter paucivorans]|uniref:hypothetical protein n=1 Tax=Clostridiisalibacter paucivorans TaxID=408753 RepID=UPI00047B8885|nr:hypothetical protein [Clostridiisalibacter paucivorans]